MSKKFNNGIWRKIKCGVSLGIATLLGVAFTTIIVLPIVAIIIGAIGAIISVCWNAAIPTMFGVQRMTVIEAMVVVCTISCLELGYTSNAKSKYAELKEEIFNKSKMEKMATVILIVVYEIVLILITVLGMMYSWNTILPKLLNVDLVSINFAQAFGIIFLFHLLSEISGFDYKESKEVKTKKIPNKNLLSIR